MTIHKSLRGTALVLAPEGRLDTVTAPPLEAEVRNMDAGVKELTFDFSALEFISSAGLRVLFSAHNAMTARGGSMKIIHPGSVVMEVFQVTGFSEMFSIE